MATLKADINGLQKTPAFTAPGPALDAKSLAGKKIYILDCAPEIPPVAEAAQGADQAAKAAHLTAQVVGAGNDDTPEDIQFLDQGITEHPGAIIVVGCDPSLLTVALKSAKAANIPVVNTNSVAPDPGVVGQGGGPYVFGVVGQATAEGAIMAEYIALTGPSDATVGVVTSSEIPTMSPALADFSSTLARYCTGCKIVDTYNVSTSELSTALAPAVSSMIDQHPKLNYVVPLADGFVAYILQGLGASHSGTQIVTSQGTPGEALVDVQAKKIAMDVGASSNEAGWQSVDQALRGMLHLPAETDPSLPMKVFTQGTLAGMDANSDSALYGTAYEAAYLRLWGVQ